MRASPFPIHTGQQLDEMALHRRQQQMKASPAPPIVVVALENVRNFGALFRIAEAVGSTELIFVDTPLIHSVKAERVARHTNQHVPHRFLTLADFLSQAATFPPLIALEITTASSDLFQTTLPQAMTWVIGGERTGIPAEILHQCIAAVHIPMFGVNSSMNLATATGIALYEWHRRFRNT